LGHHFSGGGALARDTVFSSGCPFVAAAISNASAQNVDWRGSALITAATDCAAINLSAGSIMNARYRHPGLGDNGPSARISMIANYFVNNLSDPDGDFGNTFQTVKGTVIGGGARAYNASPRMISHTPANITESTPIIVIRTLRAITATISADSVA
jgi:hypothetical protein